MAGAPWSIDEAIRTTLVAEARTTGAFAAAVVMHREFASAVSQEINRHVACLEAIEARLQALLVTHGLNVTPEGDPVAVVAMRGRGDRVQYTMRLR
jgi:hypothetical protein